MFSLPNYVVNYFLLSKNSSVLQRAIVRFPHGITKEHGITTTHELHIFGMAFKVILA